MSFVISQVNYGSSNYENLQNYILGGKRSAPTDVPRQLAPSVRLQNGLPTDQPSSGLKPIPTSSQKPFQQSNQRIPYARHFFKNDDELLGNYSIETGDVVFVHKTERRMGHGVNRCIRVMGLPQLNRRLEADEPGHTTFGPMTNALRARVVEARRESLEVARTRLQWAQNSVTRAGEHSRHEVPVAEAEQQERARELRRAERLLAEAERNNAFAIEDLDLTVDWRALTFPSDFAPDGVVIGVDDGNNDSLVNVCIGGPTAMRNATPMVRLSIDQRTPPQSVDTRAHVLDRVYVGLFWKRVGAGGGGGGGGGGGVGNENVLGLTGASFGSSISDAVVGDAGRAGRASGAPLGAKLGATSGVGGKVAFEYKLFTGRMFDKMHDNMCAAWRVGTVLDSKRVGNMGPDAQHLFVNVLVEECTVKELGKYYGIEHALQTDNIDTYVMMAENVALAAEGVLRAVTARAVKMEEEAEGAEKKAKKENTKEAREEAERKLQEAERERKVAEKAVTLATKLREAVAETKRQAEKARKADRQRRALESVRLEVVKEKLTNDLSNKDAIRRADEDQTDVANEAAENERQRRETEAEEGQKAAEAERDAAEAAAKSGAENARQLYEQMQSYVPFLG